MFRDEYYVFRRILAMNASAYTRQMEGAYSLIGVLLLLMSEPQSDFYLKVLNGLFYFEDFEKHISVVGFFISWNSNLCPWIMTILTLMVGTMLG